MWGRQAGRSVMWHADMVSIALLVCLCVALQPNRRKLFIQCHHSRPRCGAGPARARTGRSSVLDADGEGDVGIHLGLRGAHACRPARVPVEVLLLPCSAARPSAQLPRLSTHIAASMHKACQCKCRGGQSGLMMWTGSGGHRWRRTWPPGACAASAPASRWASPARPGTLAARRTAGCFRRTGALRRCGSRR